MTTPAALKAALEEIVRQNADVGLPAMEIFNEKALPRLEAYLSGAYRGAFTMTNGNSKTAELCLAANKLTHKLREKLAEQINLAP